MQELLDAGVSIEEAKAIVDARKARDAELDDWAVRQDKALKRRPANVRTGIKRAA